MAAPGPNKSPGPLFGKTVYISEVNGAKKVKSNAQVAMNMSSDTVQKIDLQGWLGVQCPNSNFWNCLKRVKLGRSYSGYRLI